MGYGLKRGHWENARVRGLPKKASHPVNCSKGGKHDPTTHEKIIDGKYYKYTYCRKCYTIP